MAHENATPRPWASRGKPSREIGHADVDRWSLVGGKRPIIDGYIITEEDAALIVEAVNAYDTLRAENERLKSAARSVLEWDARRGYPVPYAVRDPLRAALSEPAQ